MSREREKCIFSIDNGIAPNNNVIAYIDETENVAIRVNFRILNRCACEQKIAQEFCKTAASANASAL